MKYNEMKQKSHSHAMKESLKMEFKIIKDFYENRNDPKAISEYTKIDLPTRQRSSPARSHMLNKETIESDFGLKIDRREQKIK